MTERGVESKIHRAQPTELAMYRYRTLCTLIADLRSIPVSLVGSNHRLKEMSDCGKIAKSSTIHFKKDRALCLSSTYGQSGIRHGSIMTLLHVLLSSTYRPLTPRLSSTYGHAIDDLLSQLRTPDPSLSSTYTGVLIYLSNS